MAIHRSARSRCFTIIDNSIFNASLSFRAMGLLTYLLSKPDHWEVSIAQLVSFSGSTKRPDGRDSIYSIINELLEAGFMTRRPTKIGSRMNGYDYDVFDTSQHNASSKTTVAQAKSTTCELQSSPSPSTANPETETGASSEPQVRPTQHRKGEIQVMKDILPAAGPTLPFPDSPYTALPYTAETTLVNTDVEVRTDLSVNTDKATAEKTEPKPPTRAPETKARTEPVSEAGETALQEACRKTWAAYKTAFAQRYEVAPVRNAKVNAQVKELVKRLGQEAPEVARYYVGLNQAKIIAQTHDFGLLLASAESYRTQWATGMSMTSARASRIDKSQSNFDKAEEAMAILRQREEIRNADR